MQELVEGKNTIGRTAAVLKKPYKATFKTCPSSGGKIVFTQHLVSYNVTYILLMNKELCIVHDIILQWYKFIFGFKQMGVKRVLFML